MIGKVLRALYRAIPRNSFGRYRLAEVVAGLISPTSVLSEYGRRWIKDREFVRSMEAFEGRGNRRALDRKWMLRELLKVAQPLEGDTAECGTWRGGSSWLICKATQGGEKQHHAFDSFQGLSAPEPRDGTHFKAGELAVTEEDFRARLKEFDHLKVYPGWIPSRFADVRDRRFSFVHVDVDLYQPTRDSIEFFYPRLVRGGVLLMDDYGFEICPGARQAADEFFAGKPEPVLEIPTGQGLVIKA
jgi:O-methyltransferase